MTVTLTNPYVAKAHQYKGQIHCHESTNPPDDGSNTPTEVVTAYDTAGYDFVSITGHDLVVPDPAVPGLDILYITGDEIDSSLPTAYGHHISCNGLAAHIVPVTIQQVIDDAVAGGAFCHMAHPHYTGSGWSKAELTTYVSYHAIEIYNNIAEINRMEVGNAEDKWDYILSLFDRDPIWGVAVDDMHVVGTAQLNKAWVLVNADTLTEAAILTQLKAGNFYSSTGPSLAITVSDFVVTATTGESARFDWIGRNGSLLQSTDSVTSDTYGAVGNEGYIRVRVKLGELFAWSNPIMVTGDAAILPPKMYRNLRRMRKVLRRY